VLLTEGHHARGLPLARLTAALSAAPARRFGLAGKGAVVPGADADLVLVDLRDRRAPELQDRHKLSPFAGRPLPRIVRTWVRGGANRGRLITQRRDTA
jgi:allantoinase